jgi:hypothetical protein
MQVFFLHNNKFDGRETLQIEKNEWREISPVNG